MKVTGFSIVRNAIKFDYPIVEAIQSVLPLCDEFVVAVGQSDDDTLALIQRIDSTKIRIVETVWDDSLRSGGQVLAVETNKALAAVSADTDWAFYIQGDEVLHERYIPAVRQAMERYLDQPDVEGLLFKYLHFYGSYQYIGDSPQWYRHEIRIIRNTGNVIAYRDAQGFRTKDNQKLHVKPVDAYVYHYGWVKPPEVQQEKIAGTRRFWHNDDQPAQPQQAPDPFDYSTIDALAEFKDSHPAVMQPRIDAQHWQFNFNIREKKYSFKNRLKIVVERLTGWRMGEYRNYKLLR
ncbi:glycosyltransferase family 2 protein [Spirosoma oryzicola]|uniref:glycosyltransferase family 2 protein n=1 Tax=Spirosoma oryzicola TaxID=2898794 RepID=UPI001E409B87|nr:glycosyltransferase family 2 protein [Spirosoma oryzicola]UHG90246.1 glycosyltransferase family 2 protein [Spirosoma oryzicola]